MKISISTVNRKRLSEGFRPEPCRVPVSGYMFASPLRLRLGPATLVEPEPITKNFGLLLATGRKRHEGRALRRHPTLNERPIKPMVKRLREVLDGVGWEAVFVDDDSSDGTPDLVRAIFETDNRVRCTPDRQAQPILGLSEGMGSPAPRSSPSSTTCSTTSRNSGTC